MARHIRREQRKVRVTVHALATGDIERESLINLSNPIDARWLQRLMHWAWFNPVSIEITNAADDHA